jgi:hypothetical protein
VPQQTEGDISDILCVLGRVLRSTAHSHVHLPHSLHLQRQKGRSVSLAVEIKSTTAASTSKV